MKTDSKSSLAYPPAGSVVPHNRSLIKGMAAIQVLVVVGGYAITDEAWAAVSSIIALALGGLLFSRERVPDERAEQLKLKAISYGVFAGLLATSLFSVFGKRLMRFAAHSSLSASDALIVVLSVALVLFYYWRWQDGRAALSR